MALRGDLSKYKSLVTLTCVTCGGIFNRPPNESSSAKNCSIECRRVASLGRVSKNKKPLKMCASCGKEMARGRLTKKYCSRECFHISSSGNWIRADENGIKVCGRQDNNQQEIQDALVAQGCKVFVTAGTGPGAPDLLVCVGKRIVFLEVKNRLTSYGRRGLTRHQKAWCDAWQGEVYLVKSPEDALVATGFIGPWIGVGKPLSVGWSRTRELSAFVG